MPHHDALRIVQADLNDPIHQAATIAMIDAYSRDQYGVGQPLSDDARRRLIPGLQAHPTTLILLAFAGDDVAGAAICFGGFSTFSALPLLNIHDLIVSPSHRGKGVGKALLTAVEEAARARGCCKLTLEVMDKNTVALNAYRAHGFAQTTLQEIAGQAIFMSKAL